ncbi:MAG: SGNH/GDSL hydrolase family protein [Acidobacteriota bacterium]|nr:SGNH/GDSL hydrolase family protein [Acidobacteriota bacterium]
MKPVFLKLTLGIVALAGVVGVQKAPNCAASLTELEQRFEIQRKLLADWAGLIRYGSENAELPKPKAGETRVVFLGDDITERWGEGKTPFFPDKPYFNRGISGQTTPQMLVRFRQDVIKLQPKVVVIQGGLNDIASLYEPITQQMTAENIASIVELAKANNIRVVLASLTPINDVHKKQSSLRPFGKIIGTNGWLKDYAAASGSVYLDYYSAMAEGRNLKKELSDDGILPNDAGYAVMAALADTAIAQALGKK